MRRVVVTGLGMINPTGHDVMSTWDEAIQGKSGIDHITHFDTTDFQVKIAGEVKNFDAGQYMDTKEVKRSTRFVQLAIAAAKEAVEDSGLDLSGDNHLYGTSIGVGIGAMRDIEENTIILKEKGGRRISPFFLPYTIPNMAAGVVSRIHGLRGPNICTTTACTSGTHGIGEAWLYIQQGMADVMVAGGAEAAISPLSIASFTALRALSINNDNPKEASRPFDINRDGFVMGEGCGLLVLEEYEHAQKRGAKIYAEVVGYGMSADAYHITAPEPSGSGMLRCMEGALRTAKVNPDQIHYINAHGTSTRLNDSMETKAIMGIFGDHSNELNISSTKSVTGHCLGAAGGIEAVYTVKAVHHQVAPPTANYTTPDPECPLNYTPNDACERKIEYAMSNSFGFGGTNGSLTFKRMS